MKKITLLCCLLTLVFITIAQDSTYDGKAGITDVGESDPGLFMVMMILLGVCIACFILISALIVVASLILAGLTAAGIIGVSFIAGLYKRSVKTGFKWLYVLSAGVVGGIAGIAVSWLVKHLFHLSDGNVTMIIAGAFCGLIAGLVGGRVLLYFTVKMLGKLR